MTTNIANYSYDAATLAEIEKIKTVDEAKTAAGGSSITALALVLGIVANKMTDNLIDLATRVGNAKDENYQKAKDGEDTDYTNETVLTALLQADTQKLGMFMQAMNNAIKTLGEAESTVARKN